MSYVTSFVISRQPQPPPGAGSNEAQGVAIPSGMYEEVWRDNVRFGLDRHVWAGGHGAFLADLLAQHLERPPAPQPDPQAPFAADPGPARLLFELAARFYFDVVLHSRDRSLARARLLPLLERLLPLHLPGCRWLVDRVSRPQPELGHWSVAELALLDCRSAEARQLFVDGLVILLRALHPHEAHLLLPRPGSRGDGESSSGSEAEADSDSSDEAEPECPIQEEPAVTARLVRRLLAFQDHAPLYRYWRIFSQFCEVFARLADLGPEERRFLLQRGAGAQLGDLFLHDESPLRKKKSKVRMGDRYEQPNFYWLVAALDRLYTACLPWPAAQLPAPPTLLPGGPLRLPESDLALVRADAFWNKLIRDGGGNAEATVRLVQHFQYQHRKQSELVLQQLRDALAEAEPERLGWLMRLAAGVLSQEDDFQESRVGWLVDDIVARLTERRGSALSRRYVLEGIRGLRQMLHDSEAVRLELAKVPSRIAWMDAWLRAEEMRS